MKRSLLVLFTLFLAATCQEPDNGMLLFSCPNGCNQTLCSLDIGCPDGKCMPGYCSRIRVGENAVYCCKDRTSLLYTRALRIREARLINGRILPRACVQRCPPGEFCYRKNDNVCISCRVSNCYRCIEYHMCDSCNSGYTLSSDKRQCTRQSG